MTLRDDSGGDEARRNKSWGREGLTVMMGVDKGVYG